MKKMLILGLFVSLGSMAFAADGANYDIIERTINFVIFFALIYYFAAGAIKGIFKARRDDIANSLAKIQERLQESKAAKQKAENELAQAKRLATEIVDSAHKEAAIIAQKIEESAKVELENLVRQYNDQLEIEIKRVRKQLAQEIVDEFLTKDSVSLGKDVLAQSLLNKAA